MGAATMRRAVTLAALIASICAHRDDSRSNFRREGSGSGSTVQTASLGPTSQPSLAPTTETPSTAPSIACDVTVTTVGVEFAPNAVEINLGQVVCFEPGRSHNVLQGATAGDCTEVQQPLFGSSRLGKAVTHRFSSPGTYHFFCSPHCSLGMSGTIIVREGTPAPSSWAPTTVSPTLQARTRTFAPVTAAPTSLSPTLSSQQNPISYAPTTVAPTSSMAPVTFPPVTNAPTWGIPWQHAPPTSQEGQTTVQPELETEIFMTVTTSQLLTAMTSSEKASLEWNCLYKIVDRLNAVSAGNGGILLASDATRTLLTSLDSRRGTSQTVEFSAYFLTRDVSAAEAVAAAATVNEGNPIVAYFTQEDGSVESATAVSARIRSGTAQPTATPPRTVSTKKKAVSSYSEDNSWIAAVIFIPMIIVLCVAGAMYLMVLRERRRVKYVVDDKGVSYNHYRGQGMLIVRQYEGEDVVPVGIGAAHKADLPPSKTPRRPSALAGDQRYSSTGVSVA